MASEEEHPKENLDIFMIGIYALAALVVLAVIYAIIEFPTWLKST